MRPLPEALSEASTTVWPRLKALALIDIGPKLIRYSLAETLKIAQEPRRVAAADSLKSETFRESLKGPQPYHHSMRPLPEALSEASITAWTHLKAIALIDRCRSLTALPRP